MFQIKSIRLYFLSLFKLISINTKKLYYKSNHYNSRIHEEAASRINYFPSSFLLNSLLLNNNETYKIPKLVFEEIWDHNETDVKQYNNLHNFLRLNKVDRKQDIDLLQNLLKSWIHNFKKYHQKAWAFEVIGNRIIAWLSNANILIKNSDENFKKIFFKSILKQTNHITQNIKSISFSNKRLICCSAIILSGLTFKEKYINLKLGIKELDKLISNYYDKNGFPYTRNPEDVLISLKYLILIREWLKEAKEIIPENLNKIIYNCGSCFEFFTNSQKKLPLFNGSTDLFFGEYQKFLTNLKYKFECNESEKSGYFKINNKKIYIFFDSGEAPKNYFSNSYQAGCLSFEIISNGCKLVTNSGFGKFYSENILDISRSTAAHSALYLNDYSSCAFSKNKVINLAFGKIVNDKCNVLKKEIKRENNNFTIEAEHDGYKKKFGYIHNRKLQFNGEEKFFIGQDTLISKKKRLNLVTFFIRFHLSQNTKATKTQDGKSVLISLENGEGWIFKSENEKIYIEKSLFFGEKKNILNCENIAIVGSTKNIDKSINWSLKKIS